MMMMMIMIVIIMMMMIMMTMMMVMVMIMIMTMMILACFKDINFCYRVPLQLKLRQMMLRIFTSLHRCLTLTLCCAASLNEVSLECL